MQRLMQSLCNEFLCVQKLCEHSSEKSLGRELKQTCTYKEGGVCVFILRLQQERHTIFFCAKSLSFTVALNKFCATSCKCKGANKHQQINIMMNSHRNLTAMLNSSPLVHGCINPGYIFVWSWEFALTIVSFFSCATILLSTFFCLVSIVLGFPIVFM